MMQGSRRRHKNPRPQTSCVICHRRKVRCDMRKPCDRCRRRGQAAECRYKDESEEGADAVGSDPGTMHQGWDAEPQWAGADTDVVHQHQPNEALSASPAYQPQSLSPAPDRASLQPRDSASTAAVTQRSESRLPTHDWTSDSPTLGRSHSSWALQLFKPLVAYLGDEKSPTQRKDEIPLLKITQEQWRRKKLQGRDSMVSATLFDELPPAKLVRSLVQRYFETFHTILPVLDQASFTHDLGSLLDSPASAPMHLLVQVLLVIALASGTYPRSQAPIPQSRAFVWLDLASSVPTTALELGECNIDILRVIALLNAGKQALKFSETADYIYSGAGVRFAMMLGLNRGTLLEPQKRRIWETVRELDLHACLACGAAPTVPPGTELDLGLLHEEPPAAEPPQPVGDDGLSTDVLLGILSRSLPTRIKIAALVNTEQHLRFEDVMQLSRQLAREMSPVSEAADVPEHHQQSFAFKYVSFIYHKFLVALHRPFTTLNDPAFYLSRDICRSRAQRHYRDVVAAFRDGVNCDAFQALVAGNGTIFRIEAIQSALWLSFELYRSDDYNMYMPGISGSSDRNRAVIQNMLKEGVGFAEKALRTHELAGAAFLIPSLVLQHAAVRKTWPVESQRYQEAMRNAAKCLEDKFTNIVAKVGE